MANKTKRCHICGATANNTQYSFYDFVEIRDVYRVLGYKDCCPNCGDKADSFVDFYGIGKRKKAGIKRLKNYLRSGLLPQRDFTAMMNGGYY